MDHVLLPMLHLFNDGYLAAMPLFLPFLTEMFGITLGQVGFLGSLLNFSGIFLALPAGLAAARYGATKILNYAVLLLCLAFLVLGFSSGFPVIVCAFVLASVAFGIFHPIAFAAVARQGQDGSLGRRLGTFAATGDIGRIGFAATVTLLIAYSSWRTVSFLYAAMAAIVFSVCLAARRCTRGTVAGMEGKKRTLDMSLFRNHRFLLSTVASVMDSFANSSLFIFLPFLLTYRGIDVALMGAFTGVFICRQFAWEGDCRISGGSNRKSRAVCGGRTFRDAVSGPPRDSPKLFPHHGYGVDAWIPDERGCPHHQCDDRGVCSRRRNV